MTSKYGLEFHPKALKEFSKLGTPIREQFKVKLAKILEEPHIPSSMLRGGLKGTYKIKLRGSGFRLVYKVEEERLIVLVLSVGKRDKSEAYGRAQERAS